MWGFDQIFRAVHIFYKSQYFFHFKIDSQSLQYNNHQYEMVEKFVHRQTFPYASFMNLD